MQETALLRATCWNGLLGRLVIGTSSGREWSKEERLSLSREVEWTSCSASPGSQLRLTQTAQAIDRRGCIHRDLSGRVIRWDCVT